ncbi:MULTISPECIES: septal ring lytic transglycosylase RlpA family protein [unclassified Treponema]|uniref:septal ring lytic transglycosylase RlpA family protein n=1 Tax=unclassified Treponema TaxID=2638727 RepID=UPI0020A3CD1B|nr:MULTISPECIES: septal ring lytic transglycosylase RlpA family protein [unclassified Treponema]UTC67742.1 septal ring lytic transglycosylase RlpA family protein [Treponema sp. OMZ 789]UTC70470.1 septal ring lytic transglycosylase RlpA family protein [Treponema sp. OMZ 790]UTC73180.1 septal ring lytic transglycosylase RlpA family protein [Treponema sp. OMZ 791]
MKKTILILILSLFFTHFLIAQGEIISEETYASFYGDAFNGKPTANGEIFDMASYTAAHKTLPFGTLVEVTNLENGRKVIVRINDRGPFVGNREIDVSKAAAEALDMLAHGVVRVRLRKVDPNNMGSFTNTETQEKPANRETTPERTSMQTQTYMEPDTRNQNLVYIPAKASETSGVLWRIQLGSFKREENAMRLVIKLRKIGFEPAYEKAEATTRVVLYGIRPHELEKVKRVLELNSFNDYVLRQENW